MKGDSVTRRDKKQNRWRAVVSNSACVCPGFKVRWAARVKVCAGAAITPGQITIDPRPMPTPGGHWSRVTFQEVLDSQLRVVHNGAT